MIQFKKFTDSDWDSFSGAESLPNGDEPLIGEWDPPKDGTYVTIIISGNGVSIIVSDDYGDIKAEYISKSIHPNLFSDILKGRLNLRDATRRQGYGMEKIQ